MDVILHIGAHRCATTSFQGYLRANRGALKKDGVGFWGPFRTRDGLFSGVIPVPGPVTPARQLKLARGLILTQIEIAHDNGISQLVISDENMIGAPRLNARTRSLYGSIGARLAQYNHVFDGHITRIALSIRALDTFWASTLAFSVRRGHNFPDSEVVEAITMDRRTWRDVITDIACAMPDTEILVMPFEIYAGQPEAKLRQMTAPDTPIPAKHHRRWLNRSPDLEQLREIMLDRGDDTADLAGDGRWSPFNDAQTATLREKYYDDLYWLRAGADGLAKLTEETSLPKTRINLAGRPMTKGQTDDIQNGRVA